MLGLPSTTEVGRRLPKEAFYRNLKLEAKTRAEFVHLIEAITIANSIKATTVNLGDGESVREIMVLSVLLKGEEQPRRAIEAITKANPHKLVFHTEPTGTTFVFRKALYSSQVIESLTLAGSTLDEAWDSICSQIVFADVDGADVDGRIDRARRRAALEAEITALDQRARKATQISRKNELFAQLARKKRELHALGKEN